MPLVFVIKAHLKAITPVVKENLLTHDLRALKHIGQLIQKLLFLFSYVIHY